jgi:hypothetical protein
MLGWLLATAVPPPPISPSPPPPPPMGLAFSNRLPISEARSHLAAHPFISVWSNASCPFKAHEECYGEVTEDGYEQILQGMPPRGAACALTPDSNFVDIGSGYGRLAMYIRLRTNISSVTGFELNACRHRAAVKGRAKIEKAHKERSGLRLLDGLRLVQGDVRSHHLGRATHIFMSVQCWGPELISTIVASLVPMAPNMRCMIFSATGAKSILNASPNATVAAGAAAAAGAGDGAAAAATAATAVAADGGNLAVIDRWGELENAIVGVPTSWTPTEALFVGRRGAESAANHARCARDGDGGGARCRHAKLRSVRGAPSFWENDEITRAVVSWSVGVLGKSLMALALVVAVLVTCGFGMALWYV